ncbi:MAG TPA: TolC family protein [Longimicrobiales bacterium]|nr:TolC family protein [Longimicrobiales bacterium]
MTRTREARGLHRVAALALGLVAAAAAAASAQEAPPSLTLDEAIRLAKDFNPTYQSTRNDRSAADWRLREAYSGFLPTANANSSFSWVEGGAQRFGTVDLGTSGTDWYQSYYNLSVNWTLDGNTVFGVPAARANRQAVDARITAAEFDLESQVALQYMAVLRAQDGVGVAQRQLERAGQNLQIVRSRVSSGAAAGTDGKQAEVDHGRAEVGLIQAQRQYREGMALLAERLGTNLGADTRLSSAFPVFQPGWDRDELMAMAMGSHPSLRAYEAQERAAGATAKQVASQYFPSFSVTGRMQGAAQEATNRDFVLGQVKGSLAQAASDCQFGNALLAGVPGLPGKAEDCGRYAYDDAFGAAALAQNNAFPFNFTKLPLQLTLQVSVPIFTGFSRQRQVSEAFNQAEDAKHDRRAEELRLRTAVTQAFDALSAAHQVVRLEERNRSLAEEQLQMQQRRYALGAAALLELLDAQTSLTTADQAYLNAVYDFHWNLIRLEAAVGRPLRPE